MGRLLLRYAGKQEEFASLDKEGEYVVGRHPDNEVVIPPLYSDVSRVHCVIQIAPNSVSVTDSESTYGTYVNGIMLDSGVSLNLVSGDRLRLGKHLDLDVVPTGTNGNCRKNWRGNSKKHDLFAFLGLR